jgi:hypothetical protein
LYVRNVKWFFQDLYQRSINILLLSVKIRSVPIKGTSQQTKKWDDRMIHLNFSVIKTMEVISEDLSFRPMIRFEGKTYLPLSPDEALHTALMVIKDMMLLGEYTLGIQDNQCEERLLPVYELVRNLTIEQLQSIVSNAVPVEKVG